MCRSAHPKLTNEHITSRVYKSHIDVSSEAGEVSTFTVLMDAHGHVRIHSLGCKIPIWLC